MRVVIHSGPLAFCLMGMIHYISMLIKTPHGIAILGTCLLVVVLLVSQVSKELDIIGSSIPISPRTQLAQVADVTSGLVGHWMFDEGS